MSVFLKDLNRSKTDPFRQGIAIPLYRTGNAIFPVFSSFEIFLVKAIFKIFRH